MGWALATVAPWALSAGLVVSSTASARNGTPSDGLTSAHVSPIRSAIDSVPIIPPLESLPGAPMVSRLRLHEADTRMASAPGSLPRDDMKPGMTEFPQIDRSGKSDHASTFKPSLSRQALAIQASLPSVQLSVDLDDPATSPLERQPDKMQNLPEMQGSEWPDSDSTTTGSGLSSPTTAATDEGSTGTGTSLNFGDGTTPAVSSATTLSSATPAPFDLIPVEVASHPVTMPKDAWQTLSDEKPDYTALVNARNMQREERCLAEAVYFEARSESPSGQAAVAQVVLNRVRSGLYPRTICGVVYQNANRYLGCQFTFACEGKSLRTTDTTSWAQAQRIAGEVLNGKTYLSQVGGATHYHADYVKPGWSRRLKKMDVIGRHIFYKLRPGQT